jgi:hypothetical protein
MFPHTFTLPSIVNFVLLPLPLPLNIPLTNILSPLFSKIEVSVVMLFQVTPSVEYSNSWRLARETNPTLEPSCCETKTT